MRIVHAFLIAALGTTVLAAPASHAPRAALSSAVSSLTSTPPPPPPSGASPTPSPFPFATISESGTYTAVTPASGNAVPTGPSTFEDAPLPLRPTVTPALGLAGILLIATGMLYALIGIRILSVQAFLSSTYLVALAITVLIVHVMSLPVTDAMQGAYLVAACVPGMLLGAGAVVFKDLAQGLGCLLGGYCLAMFFLVTKPGGLIPSTAGKSIFVACFTLAVFSASFSRRARSHALIGSTSLAGATAAMLGIDCFSLAGLKEFWLYIWAVNGSLFSPETTTYPLTRGIKVEIAGIVVLALFGVLAQAKIWDVVRARREKKASERVEEGRRRGAIEEGAGDGNDAGGRHWEDVYEKQDSGIGTQNGSSRKDSLVAGEATGTFSSPRDSIEPVGLTSSQGQRGTDRSAPDIFISIAEEDREKAMAADDGIALTSVEETARGTGALQQDGGYRSDPPHPSDDDVLRSLRGKSLKPRSPRPLPFAAAETPSEQKDGGGSSAAPTVASSGHEQDGASNRFSTSSISKTLRTQLYRLSVRSVRSAKSSPSGDASTAECGAVDASRSASVRHLQTNSPTRGTFQDGDPEQARVRQVDAGALLETPKIAEPQSPSLSRAYSSPHHATRPPLSERGSAGLAAGSPSDALSRHPGPQATAAPGRSSKVHRSSSQPLGSPILVRPCPTPPLASPVGRDTLLPPKQSTRSARPALVSSLTSPPRPPASRYYLPPNPRAPSALTPAYIQAYPQLLYSRRSLSNRHAAAPPVDHQARRASMLAAWRDGLANEADKKNKGPEADLDAAREAAMAERERTREAAERERERKKRGEWRSEEVVGGDGVTRRMGAREREVAHRQVLKKMQAGARTTATTTTTIAATATTAMGEKRA